MDRTALLRKLDELLDEFERGGWYGNIQIDFQAGRPDLIRKLTTQKIPNGGNTRYEHQRETR